MIDIIVSKVCPQCDAQRTIMQKSFFSDEYRVIELGSPEFEKYDLKDKIDAVPFIVIKDDDGSVIYADKGKRDGTQLHQLIRTGEISDNADCMSHAFNLKNVRTSMATGLLSRHLDA